MMSAIKCRKSRCLAALIIAATAFIFLAFHLTETAQVSVISMFSEKTSSPSFLSTLFSHNTNARKKSISLSINTSIPHNLKVPSLFADKGLAEIARMHKVEPVDCQAIFNNSAKEIEEAKAFTKNVSLPLSDADYLNITANCDIFLNERGYIMTPVTEEEENFPLAFSIVVFKEVEMVERFLRAIYRPQNYYCIHVDKKSNETFFKAIASIAKCFTNVFLTSKRIDVVWGMFSVLEPELLCMEELWQYPKWKYFFTTTGQEFPLKTNLELVQILKVYDGANDIEGTIKWANKERWRSKPPLGIRAVKGSVHITVNRGYVDYILHNETAKVLLEWVKRDTSVPDETYFATLNHNPQLGIRGAYKGEPENDKPEKPFLTRFKNWGSFPCSGGQYVRGICILTLGDLPLMIQAKHFFANKFYLSQDRVVIGCLEEMIFNRTRDESMGIHTFNTSYYAEIDTVKNKV